MLHWHGPCQFIDIRGVPWVVPWETDNGRACYDRKSRIMKATSQVGANTSSLTKSKKKRSAEETDEGSASRPFSQVFQNLMGKRTDTDMASEEEVYAAAMGQQLRQLFGVDTYTEFKLSFKIAMSEPAPGRSGPSAERSANIALRSLVKSGLITSQQAHDIRDTAFAAAQLDDDPTRLFDGKGGDTDETVAVSAFDQAAALAAERMFLFRTGAATPKISRATSLQKYARIAGK
jgi:hypothetical protein